jgi:hypothetical protein
MYLDFIIRTYFIYHVIKIELIDTTNSLIYTIWNHNLLKVEMF